MKKKVVIGMSGGVDSSVAAYLLLEQGYEVIGVTMLMGPEKNITAVDSDNTDTPMSGVQDAKKVAEVLHIPHYVLDFREEFKKNVMDYFTEEYLCGRTPNPCNVCNRYVKWEALLNRSRELGAEYIATGHYARIDRLENGRYAIRNSVTTKKDQTYALYDLTQEQLSHTLMPIGVYEKTQIREIAERAKLPVATKKDSQDICFIPNGDYAAFLEAYAKDRIPGEGAYIDREGNIIGEHKGITHYTIGQRKGLNIAMGHPVFVTGIHADKNEVIIGEDEDLYTDELICKDFNYMARAKEEMTGTIETVGKIRYAHKGTPCTLNLLADGTVHCKFSEKVRAITPGQAAVFYEGDHVLGGGIIL